MNQKIFDSFAENPIVAAVKDMKAVDTICGEENVSVVFTLFGDVCAIPTIVEQLKRANKIVFVHIDLITGLAAKEVAVDFIKRNTAADGIISTKPQLVKRAKELGLCTVFRVFLLDSLAFDSIHKQYLAVDPDFTEVLPGVAPKLIRMIKRTFRAQIIAGGFISEKEDVMAALDAGALAVSTSNESVWKL